MLLVPPAARPDLYDARSPQLLQAVARGSLGRPLRTRRPRTLYASFSSARPRTKPPASTPCSRLSNRPATSCDCSRTATRPWHSEWPALSRRRRSLPDSTRSRWRPPRHNVSPPPNRRRRSSTACTPSRPPPPPPATLPTPRFAKSMSYLPRPSPPRHGVTPSWALLTTCRHPPRWGGGGSPQWLHHHCASCSAARRTQPQG